MSKDEIKHKVVEVLKSRGTKIQDEGELVKAIASVSYGPESVIKNIDFYIKETFDILCELEKEDDSHIICTNAIWKKQKPANTRWMYKP